MNEELQKKLIEWVENIGKLTMEEIPPFMQEIATYGFWSNLIAGIIILAALFFLIWIGFILLNKFQEDKEPEWIIIFLISLVIKIFLFIGLLDDIQEACKAKLSPKLYVLEKFLNR